MLNDSIAETAPVVSHLHPRSRGGLKVRTALQADRAVGKVGTDHQNKKFGSTDDGFFVLWVFSRHCRY